MPRILFVVLLFTLAACSDSPPPPAPVVKSSPPPEAPAKPEAKPEAKAAEAPKPDPNRELTAKVKRALEDEAKIQAGGIDVTAAEGVVTLWGTTASSDERTRAGRIAAKVDGVKSVENKLAVVRGS